MTEKKYYLCTFRVVKGETSYYAMMLLDYHPIEYVSMYGSVLINHIEVTEDQYEKYHIQGLNERISQ